MSLRRENRDHGEQGEKASSAAKAECFGQIRTEIRKGHGEDALVGATVDCNTRLRMTFLSTVDGLLLPPFRFLVPTF